jgi:hypothetical protein
VSPALAQLFRPGANAWLRLGLLAVVIVPAIAVLLGGAYVRSDYATRVGMNPAQPVPFSHQHHVGGLGLDCRYCHTGVETSAVAGVPPTETCMTCHSQLWTNAQLLAPVRQSLAKQTPIRWTRVHDLPGYVYFDHSIHVAKGVGCTTCHGQVDVMPLMHKAASLQMQWCLDCHRSPERYLRPLDRVFSVDWTPPDNQSELGRRLKDYYRIDVQHLTDCSVCHR